MNRPPNQECRNRGIPVIYDEVFCGLWRLGVESTRELLGVDPDVSCYAKLLTGGLVPMSVTIASERVFESFSGAKVSKGERMKAMAPTRLSGQTNRRPRGYQYHAVPGTHPRRTLVLARGVRWRTEYVALSGPRRL